jgi:hypothetical protein
VASLRELLSKDILAGAEADLRKRESLSRFHMYLTADDNDIFLRALYRFVNSVPWRYWDPEIVANALEVLENSAERTASAIAIRSRRMGIGFENLFRQTPTANYEEKLSLSKMSDLLRLATEFHPEYLRCAEHIFSNLLIVYWSVLRKGDVSGKYDLRGAVNLINQKGHHFLLKGYNDDIRNAVAHGQVVFRGFESIQYGPEVANVNFAAFEFLSAFDSLRRTSNNLALALLLFLARHRDSLSATKDFILPPSIMAFLAGAGIERTGLNVVGVVESEIYGLGKQLHLAVQTFSLYKPLVLLECAQLTMHLLDNGGSGYARYLFDIDQGKSLPSLVIVKPDRLAALLQENAPVERLSEIFDDTPLLWYDESKFRTNLKAWKFLFKSHLRIAKEGMLAEWRNAGIVSRSRGRYLIRKIENVSAGRIPRVNVTAVLRYPDDANDRELIREIVYHIIKRTSKIWVDTKKAGFEGDRGKVGRPKYIWLRLCRLDGTIRWLNACGWASGNLVAMAERAYGLFRKPLQIRNPEEVWKGVQIRYSMDIEILKKMSGDPENDEDTDVGGVI